MKRVKFLGNERVDVVEVDPPEPKPGEALVRIVRSAICGSEMPSYRNGMNTDRHMNPGHEMVGVVEDANGSIRYKSGSRVGITVLSGCGACVSCLSGNPKHCAEGSSIVLDSHGDLIAAPESVLVPLSDDVGWEAAVLLCGDTCGTPFRAIERIGGIRGNDTAAVFGCGPIGLGCVAWLSFFGAKVIVSEPNAYRRALASSLGAATVIDPRIDDSVEAIRSETGGGADVCFDCSENEATTLAALEAVAVGGRVGFIGEKPTATVRPSEQIIHKEIIVSGSWYFTAADYAGELFHFRRGFDPTGIITHGFPLIEAREAYELFAGGNTGKVVFEAVE